MFSLNSSCIPFPSLQSAVKYTSWQFQCANLASVDKNVPLLLGVPRHKYIFWMFKKNVILYYHILNSVLFRTTFTRTITLDKSSYSITHKSMYESDSFVKKQQLDWLNKQLRDQRWVKLQHLLGIKTQVAKMLNKSSNLKQTKFETWLQPLKLQIFRKTRSLKRKQQQTK